tara:strand:+ start:33902 stop:35548 length:1647 start_codon:yes stop_codon:yes gene_type:complete
MDKIWIDKYAENVPGEISQLQFQSIIDLVDHASNKFSKHISFNNLGSSLSFQDTRLYSERLAAYMSNELSIVKGDKIAIMLPNLLSFPVGFFGSLRLGAVVININPLFTTRELKNVLEDCEAETIIVLDKFLVELEPILNDTKISNIIVCRPSDLLSPLMKIVVSSILYFKGDYKSLNKGLISFSDIMIYKNKPPVVTIARDDIALLQYTGGTTGKSKAAVLTHSNLLSNVHQLELWVKSIVKEGQEIIITALPLYHIFSLTVNLLFFYKIGAKNILITNPRNLKDFVKTLSKHRFTVITAVNTLFNLLLTSSKFRNSNFDNLKFSVGGGMAVLKSTAKKWKDVTGCSITQGYGLTETSPIVSVNPLSEDFNGSIGLPLPSTDVSIRDDNDQEVALGNIGELCVKGPQVMSEYWNNIDETKKSFTDDGFFKTGDISKIDENGFLYIVDRKKDMIISSGYNVYPNEIEDYVSNHDSVLECGVVGKPDLNRGEIIFLYVVKKQKDVTKSEIAEYCRSGLTLYKQPKKIIFVNEIPKNNVGKILRRKLRDL